MLPVELLVDIHCTRPEVTVQPNYRIYIDDDLITERNWAWDNNTLIREHLWVDLEPGKDYNITLEPILAVSEQAKFDLKNFQIIKRNYEVITEQDNSICFKTYKYKIKERSNETRRIFERRRSRS
jgi:hypothetical protein